MRRSWHDDLSINLNISQGKTEEKALANLQEALELYFEPPRPMIKPVIRQFEVELHAAA